MVRSDQVTTKRVRQVVGDMLADPTFRDAAQRLAREISIYDAIDRFRSFLAQTLDGIVSDGPETCESEAQSARQQMAAMAGGKDT